MHIKVNIINYEKDEFGLLEKEFKNWEEKEAEKYYRKLTPLEKELRDYTMTVEIDRISGLATFSFVPDLEDYFLRLRVLQVVAPEQLN